MSPRLSRKPFWTIAATFLVLGGCAGNPPDENTATPSADDPWEALNRYVYKGNRRLDRYTLKPIARGYRQLLPSAVRTGIDNFFVNLRSPWHSINNLLQAGSRSARARLAQARTR